MTKAEKTKQFIIEQSAPIFNTKGIAGTAMSDIMQATKLAKGSLYVHFDSKEELSYCVADYNFEKLSDRVAHAINKYRSPKQKLLAFIDFFNNPLNPPIPGGCPMINISIEADDTNPVLLNKVHRVMQDTQDNIKMLVELGIAEGEFNPAWNADLFALKAFALIEGGILITRVSGNADQMRLIVNLIKDEIAEKSI